MAKRQRVVADQADPLLIEGEMPPVLPAREMESRQATAKRAAAILVSKQAGFVQPTAKQRQNVVVAFAKKNLVVYGRAFDILKLSKEINLDSSHDVEQNLAFITVYEIKSSNRTLPPDFTGYFFALTTAELLVAQSLKKQFKFVFVNTKTSDFVELQLAEVFARARGIYPTWSIAF